MMKTICLCGFLAFLPASAWAQAVPQSWVATILDAQGAPQRTDSFPHAGMNCDDLSTPAVIDGIVNPTHLRWPNPFDPTRACLVDYTAAVQALPDGTGYRVTIHWVLRDVVTGAILVDPESDPSNRFSKVTNPTQPPPRVPYRPAWVQAAP